MITIIVKKGFLESYHEGYSFSNDDGLKEYFKFCEQYSKVRYKVRVEFYSDICSDMPDFVFVKTTGCLYSRSGNND